MGSNRFCWFAATFLAGCLGGFLPPAVLGQSANPVQTPDDPAAHYAKGEVKYGEIWVPLVELFQNYRQIHAEIEKLLAESKKAQSGLDDLNRQIYVLRGENDSSKRPVRTDMAKATAEKRRIEGAMRASPPVESKYQTLPSKPSRIRYPDDNAYQNALNSWNSECNRIQNLNDTLRSNYQKQLADYQKMKTQGEALVKEAVAKIAECEKQLAVFDKQLADAQTPLLAKRQTLTDEIQALGRQVHALLTRSQAIEQAMRDAPENVLFSHQIVEWEGTFYLLDELRTLYAQQQAEINRVRDALQADAQRAGRSFPNDWRHSQQDKMDALKALIERVEKVAAAPR
jgi:DNA repair exonuclease SbcCD ATPase subunit